MTNRVTNREYVVEKHSIDATVSQVLRKTVQVVEDLLDGGDKALHDVGLGGGESSQRPVGEGADTLLHPRPLFLHHCLFHVSTRISNMLQIKLLRS